MIMDLLIPFIIALPYKGYSHTKSVMSVLGCKQSPLSMLYNVWMIFSGCIISLYGYKLFIFYRTYHFGLALTLFILMLLYGIGDEVISGFFPLNQSKQDITLSTKIHGIGSVLGFLSLQFVPLILSLLTFKSGETILSWISIICFILGLISFSFFIMGEKPKFKNTVFALEGLWQRILCLLLYMPLLTWGLVGI